MAPTCLGLLLMSRWMVSWVMISSQTWSRAPVSSVLVLGGVRYTTRTPVACWRSSCRPLVMLLLFLLPPGLLLSKKNGFYLFFQFEIWDLGIVRAPQQQFCAFDLKRHQKTAATSRLSRNFNINNLEIILCLWICMDSVHWALAAVDPSAEEPVAASAPPAAPSVWGLVG